MALSWTARRRGAIYCSPGCGGNCRWADYQRAVRASHRAALVLGRGWTASVWENLGWHWHVRKGPLTIRALGHAPGYYGCVDGIFQPATITGRTLSGLYTKLLRQLADARRQLDARIAKAAR